MNIRKKTWMSVQVAKRYPRESKKEAVRLSYLDDRTYVDVANELGINVENLYRWRREMWST